jgi:hypothetical protein
LLCCFVLFAASANAAELKKTNVVGSQQHPVDFTTLGCDDGVEFNAFFQSSTNFYGNVFNFGAVSSQLDRVEFYHCGWNTLGGPYNYNVELWDAGTCTRIAQAVGKQAADAFNCSGPSPSILEVEALCNDNLRGTGNVIVAIDPNSCAAPNDCYPDVTFDDQAFITCPFTIAPSGSTGVCTDLGAQGAGPFLLRIDLNGCQTAIPQQSWGGVKTLYR